MQIAFPKPTAMKCVSVSVKDSTLSRVALRPPLALGNGVEHQRPDHSAHIEGAPQDVLEMAQVLSTHDLCHRAF